ncbi:hypothetical protein BpHYR1_016077 [Brachionus plicatilis]|uniref:Uncharacterized protein n=1 Tax=Brachionus plicatilis TaxID=10195 RepID=A0A3M7SLM2_BRAPC|nr:hypothetical protein BpHYR1_016077 [Brachionus plicatilis]
MALNKHTIPSWLTDVREDATKSNEWAELSKHIYDAVDQHLSQSHISYFSELTEDEKNLILERAARSLASSDGGRVYENLQSKLSYILDQTVNNQVARKMLEESLADTKTDLVLDTTAEGIVTLLRKNPEQKYKLKVFLNQSIPQPIRFLTWQLYFSNSNERKLFVQKLEKSPKLCLSPQDAEIQRKCDSIINSEATFKEMNGSIGISNSLKGILSYYHSTIKEKRSLYEWEYLYALPIVNAHHPEFLKNESPSERSMALLIEIYIQFVKTLPNAIISSNNPFNESSELDFYIKKVINILDQHDMSLLSYIKNLASRNSSSDLVLMKVCCNPLIKSLFSSYLNLHALMFVWDQYTIGSDVVGFHEEFIPIITAIILMLLRDQLMSVNNLEMFNDCIKNQTNFIQTRQIQTIFNKYFFKNLQTKLNSSSRVGPIIDPTVGRLQPWEHWHQDIIPRRTTRIPNDADEALKAEIARRIMAERAAKEEVERLRRELEELRKRPPKEIIRYDDQEPVEPPKPKEDRKYILSNNNTIQQPVADLLLKLKYSVAKISEGEGENNKLLDNLTLEDLKIHKDDLKAAEMEVFGHYLGQNEWDSLDEQQKREKSQKMLAVVKKRMEKRFKDNGRF